MEDLPNDVDELNLLIRTEVAQLKFINVDEDIQNEMDVVEKELGDVEKELSELECCKSDDDKIVNEIRSEVCENVEEIVKCIGIKFGELFSKIGEKCDIGVGEFYEGSGNGTGRRNECIDGCNENRSVDGCDYIDGNECNENICINNEKCVNENIFINSENCTLDQNNCENNSNIKSTNCNKSINTINSKSTNTINKSNKKNTRCEGKLQFEYKNLPCKQWKLNILVKFRENEKLEKLNSFRQSGGEKSVSIILFLLSLQSIDNSPFRLVDEINQGMDKYNEKKVLDILFDMCERETRTQFFIISPKLVEGLCYSKGMKCIILMSDQSEDVKRAYLNG
ncbi:structural maintenance of chromosome complex subunit [Vairimorpha apis BRL 01]|uniref:Structural maintenance of chromosomes protein 5 n=1 Tax=Vairimorpha apis BRL 01 TaxID=1037528 RepID=T0KZD8_9MICR|nr:structural maintenance of chromosome complex subunit [Vairimorpha apis BRL 01]